MPETRIDTGSTASDHAGHEHAGHDHAGHSERSGHEHGDHGSGLNSMAVTATVHCMTGCAIGEIVGMAIAEALGLANAWQIGLAVALAFLFGYTLTSRPLLKAGLTIGAVIPIALAVDTVSILTMEIVDNLTVVVIPGAMNAQLQDFLFWGSMIGGFVVAFPFAWWVNRALLKRGKGRALVHQYHH